MTSRCGRGRHVRHSHGAHRIRAAPSRALRPGSFGPASPACYREMGSGLLSARIGSSAPSGAKTSTANANFRCSPGGMAPTPTTWRVTSSPRSFVIDITTAYSHASPTFGCRMVPSTRRGEKVGAVMPPPLPGAKRRCLRHDGQTLVLWRITARQCGQVRVAPAGVLRTVVTMRDDRA